jgi:protein-disulfide isomerase
MANDRLLIIGAVLVMAVLIVAVLMVQSTHSPLGPKAGNFPVNATEPTEKPGGQNAPSAPAPPPLAPAVDMQKLASSGLRMGSDSAPVIMVEYSDYQCPFCRSFWLQDFPSLKSRYIDTGKVQLVYKDFPLNFHPAAEMSAEAVGCANDQGQGWQLHDAIFEKQAAVGSGTVQYSESDVKAWAGALGLNMTSFDDCLDSGKYAMAVNDSFSEGSSLGIVGTPSFMIGKRDGSNVVPLTGALPYGTFSATIDQLLQ